MQTQTGNSDRWLLRKATDVNKQQTRTLDEGQCRGCPGSVLAADEGQELFPGLWVFPEHSEHRAGHAFTVHFLYPSHDHAHVPVGKGKKRQASPFARADILTPQSRPQGGFAPSHFPCWLTTHHSGEPPLWQIISPWCIPGTFVRAETLSAAATSHGGWETDSLQFGYCQENHG